ncbi:RidA family protein [Pseudomonas vanderleydeniana]|uniref:RidA family protein n=1 Tax=Pseudomonas vanderleydeniana TaxID=2745495 RepID=A0A9E6PFN7_9PSED|nr:RidA family protein [Pseudomonas vanderleydeniana]QXI25972.1 RidA family protein [Pseudomonas vanderleydeniana]
MAPDPQWLPLPQVLPPFRETLLALYPDAAQRFVAPRHFRLSQRDGNLLWVSGQVPRYNEEIRYTGRVGEQLSLDQARQAARLCMANFLSIVAAACDGDLQRVEQVIRITGYVRATADFGAQSEVINAASEVLVQLFGERGEHARSAIGVHSLPGAAGVEIEGVVRLRS